MDTTRDRLAGSQEPSQVRSACEAHIEWEKGAEIRATQFLKALSQAVSSERDAPPALSISELRHIQETDPIIREVLPLIQREHNREELDEDVSDVHSEFQPPSADVLSGLAVDASEDRTCSWLDLSSDAVRESMGEADESEVENEIPHSL
ncbi:unnamed protein product [Arctogadus glacialis]